MRVVTGLKRTIGFNGVNKRMGAMTAPRANKGVSAGRWLKLSLPVACLLKPNFLGGNRWEEDFAGMAIRVGPPTVLSIGRVGGDAAGAGFGGCGRVYGE